MKKFLFFAIIFLAMCVIAMPVFAQKVKTKTWDSGNVTTDESLPNGWKFRTSTHPDGIIKQYYFLERKNSYVISIDMMTKRVTEITVTSPNSNHMTQLMLTFMSDGTVSETNFDSMHPVPAQFYQLLKQNSTGLPVRIISFITSNEPLVQRAIQNPINLGIKKQ